MAYSRTALAALSLALATATPSQDARYELGLRVRAFERAFDAVCADVEARGRVCPSLEQAVQSFFGLQLAEVARNLDQARQLLATGAPASPATQWADALSLRLKSRFVALPATELRFALLATYRTESARPEVALLRLRLVDAAGNELQEPATFAIDDIPLRATIPLDVAVPGDHRLLVEIRSGDRVLAQHEQLISCARDLDARLTALAPWGKARPSDTLTATARGLFRMLRGLARGGTRESDVPAGRHLEELEAIATQQEPPFALARAGDFRIWLQTPAGAVATRVMVPPRPVAEPVPLVVAMHGAGGSENLFFDGYGAGKIVRLCRDRGWLLVAPRSGFGGAPVDAIVDAMAALFPIDRDRVFAVGHSMGAGQLMAYASRQPEHLRAIALLGGGGAARPSAGLRRLPIFLAPGEKDFALTGARRLRSVLADAEVASLDYREYEAAEHLGIVQIALNDVFAFFDRFAGK